MSDELRTNEELRRALVAMSLLVERSALAGQLGMQFAGTRDTYTTLGYPTTLDFTQYLAEYERGDIAGRIVDLPPSDTWRQPPALLDDGQNETPFTKAWTILAARRSVWHYLERVDRLNRLGRYALLLLGVRGSRPLDEPLEAGTLRSPFDVLYLQPYAEGSATIKEFETDPQSERFALPLSYTIQMGAPGAGLSSQVVHWSRVIHVAEGTLEDDVYGRPALKRCWNRLQDLMKIVGGGAEAAWRVMDRGLHADVRDGFNLPDATAVTAEIEDYLHGFQRFIRTTGMTVTPLGADTVDPSGLFGMIVSLLAAAADIPQRILIGSERGELASGQDAAQWAGQIRARREKFAEPMILRALIDRLVWAGALPVSDGNGYQVSWQPLFELDDLQQGQAAQAYAEAIMAYAPAGATDQVVPVREFRRKWLRLPEMPEADAEGNAPPESAVALRTKAEVTQALTAAGANLRAAAEAAGFAEEQAQALFEVGYGDGIGQ